MKKSTKSKILGSLGLISAALILSSCTANFCSNLDKANIAYPYEQGVTVYCDQNQIPAEYQDPAFSWQPYLAQGNTELWAYIPVDANGFYAAKKASYLTNTILATAVRNFYVIPSYDYWKGIDQKLLDLTLLKSDLDPATVTAATINPFSQPDVVGNEEGVTVNFDSPLRKFGYLKFYGEDNLNWTYWTQWNAELAITLGPAVTPNADFAALYQSDINGIANSKQSCITTKEGLYGHFGEGANWSVSIAPTTWGEAWGKGLLEGLIVYPIAWGIDVLSNSMDPTQSGIGQIWAIVIVTLIVRIVVLALTFKSTLDQQKTQALQPQIAKLQAKYPNSRSNQAEQARLSQETMALYKRNKINPASTIVTLLVQFPVFIAVWGALQGSAVLSSGEVLHLRLSDSIQSVLLNFSGGWYVNSTGWWTALVLFLLMSVFQWVSMMLPQWIAKSKNKNVPKLTANPTQDSNAKTMRFMMYGMLIFTIIMGFSLLAAMGIYWAVGAIISMIQTSITQAVMGRRLNKQKEGR